MQDAGDGGAVIGAHGNAVTLAANGDERLLDGVGLPFHQIEERSLDAAALLADAALQGAQFSRGFLTKFSVTGEVTAGALRDRFQIGNCFALAPQQRVTIFGAGERFPQGLRAAQRPENLKGVVELEPFLSRE